MKRFNKSGLCFRIILPSEEYLSQFESITTPLYEQIVVNLLEKRRLKKVGDALLPELMSGELDVSS